jgi:hypothetical protein
MAQSDAVFTGSLPRLYDDNLDTLFFTPYGTDLARRLKNLCQSALKSFQVTASKSFHFVSPFSVAFCVV